MSLVDKRETISRGEEDEEEEDNLPELDFMGAAVEAGKRRKDRCDSSESSDSGVATLSPSTSELISSPYSPCCELSSDGSSTSGYGAPSSPESSSPPPPRLHPQRINLLDHPIMTAAVSAVLSSSKRPPNPASSPNISLISFPGPGKQLSPGANSGASGATAAKGASANNIFAVALNYHQQKERQKVKEATSSCVAANGISNSSCNSNNNNNNNSTTKNKNLGADLNKEVKKPRLESTATNKKTESKQIQSSTTTTTTTGGSASCSTERNRKRKADVAVDPDAGQKVKVPDELRATVTPAPPASISVGADASHEAKVETKSNRCMWKECRVQMNGNILEHIQTEHVSRQTKAEGFVCLWDGCKVFNRKWTSLSCLESHVLSRHLGNKPFQCIFPGCGLSFSAKKTLQGHVEKHISTAGLLGAQSQTLSNRKVEQSPLKPSRRKKPRSRKQRLNIGQYVDFFDKRIMEVIKHRLATSVSFHTINPHSCVFHGQVVAKRIVPNEDTQVLVHWYPEHVIPDEWTKVKEYKAEKEIPLANIPKEKIPLIFPSHFPCGRREKTSRKFSTSAWSSSPFTPATSTSSPSPSTTSTVSWVSETKSDDSGYASKSKRAEAKREEKDSHPPLEEDDWAMQVLCDFIDIEDDVVAS